MTSVKPPSERSSIALRDTALLLIDVQQGLNHPTFFGSSRSTPNIGSNIGSILRAFRSARDSGEKPSIIHVRHHSLKGGSPLHPSNPSSDFEEYAKPLEDEPIFTKTVNSAFIGTRLEEYIRIKGIKRLVVCGITTDHCVSTSVRMAANLGVVGKEGEILLVGDGAAAHAKGGFDAELVHAVNLASLNEEFCRVISTRSVLEDMRDW